MSIVQTEKFITFFIFPTGVDQGQEIESLDREITNLDPEITNPNPEITNLDPEIMNLDPENMNLDLEITYGHPRQEQKNVKVT